ncbi:SMODS domain-containing nucleotidyltransferase [Azospirillum tabaci]|uniref:SMODS domain-containing nucleotidyltransferase n=1 Tax=Azospirillum tabaci TaxID=2752310 RepID=UPI0016603C62|nr:nucleotidyltransferase [Azospirillum tabaci]
MWIAVRQRFEALAANLKLTDAQIADGRTKHEGITQCLNIWYWNSISTSSNRILAGSWGKSTRMRPPRDIDMLFVLPSEVYYRFENRGGNKQSQLLQEVKGVLASKYPSTTMRGDGQVVVVAFTTFTVEVVPAFELQNGQFLICDTNGNGQYKLTDTKADIANMSNCNTASKGDLRHLIKMMKCWQAECNVPLRSFQIELLAIEFMAAWPHKGNGYFYHDFMVRDFFYYIIQRANGYVIVPGTGELIWLGDAWLSRAQSGYARACRAADYEKADDTITAGDEWQKIFGYYIPRYV